MKYKRIYVLTPSSYVTGGVECLYQLAHAINELGGDCYTIFTPQIQNPIPDEYAKYNIKIGKEIEVSPDNLFIVPEVFTHITQNPNLEGIQFSIWWLSVDHNRGTFNDYLNGRLLHFYQSYYAADYLKKRGAKNSFILFDPINENYLTKEIPKKENIICYSIKGERFAESIKPLLPEYKFVMLKGMTRDEVVDTLSRSKVFIDFGYHPGRDKIPREAVALKNCLITNRIGAADFYEDIPIPDQYKFGEMDMGLILQKIKECIENYDEKISDFDEFYRVISNQKGEFERQIKERLI